MKFHLRVDVVPTQKRLDDGVRAISSDIHGMDAITYEQRIYTRTGRADDIVLERIPHGEHARLIERLVHVPEQRVVNDGVWFAH